MTHVAKYKISKAAENPNVWSGKGTFLQIKNVFFAHFSQSVYVFTYYLLKQLTI